MNKHAPGGRRCDGAVGRGERGRVWTTGEHNMERRKFVLGVGALAAGGAAAVGSGAFTSVSAERRINIAVADDSEAYLALDSTDERAYTTNGELALSFNNSEEGALGLNPNSRTAFTDLFEIKNQGEDPVYVGVGLTEEDVYKSPGDVNDPHLLDYENLSGFVYAEESGSGPGLSFNGGNGNMGIDSGGRVDVTFSDNGSADPATNPRILTAGESIKVDLSLIVDGNSLGSGGGSKITVAAADPTSDRAKDGNGT